MRYRTLSVDNIPARHTRLHCIIFNLSDGAHYIAEHEFNRTTKTMFRKLVFSSRLSFRKRADLFRE
jgi:hypothetical protein